MKNNEKLKISINLYNIETHDWRLVTPTFIYMTKGTCQLRGTKSIFVFIPVVELNQQ